MSDRIRKAAGILLILAAVGSCLVFLGDPAPDPSATYETGGQPAPEIGRISLPDGTVDINTDDPEELCKLPGIGETIAALIIEEREKNGPYRYPEDLISVRWIGRQKVGQIRPYLDLEPDTEESGD